MDRILAYLEAIEGINRADRRMARRADNAAHLLLERALEAANVAWLLIPSGLREQIEPPPAREAYLPKPVGSTRLASSGPVS
jgi:hypothetical protein